MSWLSSLPVMLMWCSFWGVCSSSVLIWKTNIRLIMTWCGWQTSLWTGNRHTDLLSSPLQCLAKGRMTGEGKRKMKPRHPAEELPDCKSLNCNQKADSSAAASLLFHYSSNCWQLAPLQNSMARWWTRTASKWKVFVENFRETSKFRLDFHEAWHLRFYTVCTCFQWRVERRKSPHYFAS